MSGARYAGVVDLAAALRRGKVSAAELAAETLDLLEREGPRFGAVAALTRERGLAEARAADRALRRGAPRSELTGVPYGAKDLMAARGAPTTWGAEPFAGRVIDEDAAAIATLRRSGGVLVAKLAMVALAGGGGYGYPSASLQGATRNPWDLGRTTGGSSSGSAAAVAAGLVPYALGSETNGSIGGPSAFCGITGLRPTHGLVDRRGAMELSATLDKIGPMAHTAEDCAIVLEVLAPRFHRLDRRSASTAVRAARVGVCAEEVAAHASIEARDALATGVEEVRRLVGGRLRPVVLPDLPFRETIETIYGAEGAASLADLIESDRFELLTDAKQKAGFRAALGITARAYLEAMKRRDALAAAVSASLDGVDALLSFGRAGTAPPIDEPRAAAAGWSARLGPAGNLAGLPAIFFPCGVGRDGLPVGLQLVGRPRSEPLLCALVEAYQRETDHHRRRPPA